MRHRTGHTSVPSTGLTWIGRTSLRASSMSPVKNIVELSFEKRGKRNPRNAYRLYSTLWGLRRRAPPLFEDRWARLRAAAKTLKLSREAHKRLEWMIWYETLGQRNARLTCRHFGIPPKTFYKWRRRFSEVNLLSLDDRSRRPHRARRSELKTEQELRIVQLRRIYLHYSKLKLAILYQERYGERISSWQIQKVIQRYRLYPSPKRAENTARKRRRAVAKRRITDLVSRPETGFLFGIDTVVLWLQGTKRYVLTAIDRHSRLAFARMYTTHSSLTAADFLRRLHELMGAKLVHVQTDNGSEFHRYFEQAIKDLKLQHWWSRTKTPKDNAVCERFNRTIQEEFVGRGNGYTDPMVFNQKLTNWLIEYNFQRPHAALGYRKPIEIACPDPKALPMYSSRTSL